MLWLVVIAALVVGALAWRRGQRAGARPAAAAPTGADGSKVPRGPAGPRAPRREQLIPGAEPGDDDRDGRTSIIGRFAEGWNECKHLVVHVDGLPLEVVEGDFGVYVEEGEHVVEILLGEQVTATAERTLRRGAQWDLGELALPERTITFRGPEGRTLNVESNGGGAERPPLVMTGVLTVPMGCDADFVWATDAESLIPAIPMTLPPGDGVVELRFPTPARFSCAYPTAAYSVSLHSQDAPGVTYQASAGDQLVVPPGRYSINVYPAYFPAMSVEPRVAGGVLQLAAGQRVACEPSIFGDLGAIALSLVGDRPMESTEFWLVESEGGAPPNDLAQLLRREVREHFVVGFGSKPVSRFTFARVPWLEVDVCAGVRAWLGEPAVEDDQLVVTCQRVRRAQLPDDATIELSAFR